MFKVKLNSVFNDELFQKDKNQPLLPPTRISGHYSIPRHIKPEITAVHIEILCWGLRSLPSTNIASAASAVQFECSGRTVISATLDKQNKTLNCPEPQVILKTVSRLRRLTTQLPKNYYKFAC